MSFEAERNVIASLLTYPELLKDLILDSNYFLDPINQFCIEVFKVQYAEQNTISVLGLGEYYKHLFKKISFEKFVTYASSLIVEQVVSKSQFNYWQDIVFHSWKDKQIANLLDKYQKCEISQQLFIDRINEFANTTLETNSTNMTSGSIFKIITSNENRLKYRFPKLVENANIQEHDLPIIAARPGVGKTAFMLNLLEDLSSTYKCLYFNLEMTEKQIYARLVSMHSKIPMKCFSNLETDYQRKQVEKATEEVSKKKLKVITGSQTVRSIKNKILRESLEEHVICFIDYIGLVRTTERGQSNYERVTSIVKELRQLSLDSNCTIFVAAQIGRNSEREKDNRPKISDLKESGELEQSGTTVIMLHNENPFGDNSKAEIQAIIGKNRNGATGIIKLDYDKQTQRFESHV